MEHKYEVRFIKSSEYDKYKPGRGLVIDDKVFVNVNKYLIPISSEKNYYPFRVLMAQHAEPDNILNYMKKIIYMTQNSFLNDYNPRDVYVDPNYNFITFEKGVFCRWIPINSPKDSDPIDYAIDLVVKLPESMSLN